MMVHAAAQAVTDAAGVFAAILGAMGIRMASPADWKRKSPIGAIAVESD